MNRRARWRLLCAGVVLLGFAAPAAGVVMGPGPTWSHPAHARTIVSLEFDHATSSDLIGAQIAAAHGMNVTLFALSGRVGSAGYLTVAQLLALQARGDEIGGHTIDHPRLAALTVADQRHEICDDRAALQSDGFDVTDFAYPYGEYGPATPGIVRACGYESAREAGGLYPDASCAPGCAYAETIPPRDPYVTRATDSVLESTSLSTLEAYVTRAERHRGGWVQIVFHYVCEQCDPYSVSPETLSAFLTWLAPRAAIGTTVETVRQVINTPFVPGPIWARMGSGPGVSLTAARSCPLTPVTATCRLDPQGRRTLVRAPAAAGRLVVVTDRIANQVDLLRRGRPALRLSLSAGQPLRWWVALPGSAIRAAATIDVEYPLGRAQYLVWIQH